MLGLTATALACGGGGAGTTDDRAARPDTLSLAERRQISGWIAFVSERNGNREVYLVRADGEAERRLTESPGAEYPAAAAPDGSALLILSVDDDATRGIHRERLLLQPMDGGAARQLGPPAERVRNPAWSPDSRWIVLETSWESFRDLYRVSRDGASINRLTKEPDGSFEPAISPDGRHIVFVSTRDPAGGAEVYRMRSDGARQERLTLSQFGEWSPAWSADGRRLAFLSNREGEANRIFQMEADGSGQRRLSMGAVPGAETEATFSAHRIPQTARDTAEPAWISAPEVQEEWIAWSPTGDRIAYVTRRPRGETALWLADVTTGTRTRISDGAGNDEMPAWSPDGRYLLFVSDRDGNAEIYLARANGTAATRITHSPEADWLPRWVPAPSGTARLER